MAVATFAMGCFWKPEMIFRRLGGVEDTAVGYAGGHVPNPTYAQVCAGDTGHAEVVQIRFDPERIAYTDLLDVFWQHHDPTTRDRQGWDIGRQYRSAIFTHDDTQLAEARASLDARQAELNKPVVTDIEPLEAFYRAEDYHQRYLEKTGTVCF
ncbi:peptide-methionine (S)-S-oxide reductase MsrA [Salinisphaera hydrothermalis]|uniref:Peptide methionine sulfoxide reductase MsrA n=1 Tax=Salinisphaera hydrothermalis (strain C41B8) TaxID=1304275 RepID=A0A084IQ03_SALHC|nr:peptide-methionine (S)-S-oxide reductase MsrA [Salinisphaera hydrothermalis]KEZ78787.1 methionine sulfoxide reductase A [Salinisphaera hydrothermalis C41B8]